MRNDFNRAKRKLLITVAALVIGLLIPLLILAHEALNRARGEEDLRDQMVVQDYFDDVQRAIDQLFAREEERPFGEYSFANVPTGLFAQRLGLQISPLGALPPKSDLPGVVGYFQIDPDGTFSSPTLPSIPESNLSTLGLPEAELQARRAIRDVLLSALRSASLTRVTRESVQAPESPLKVDERSIDALEQKSETAGAKRKMDFEASGRAKKQQVTVLANEKLNQILADQQDAASSFAKDFEDRLGERSDQVAEAEERTRKEIDAPSANVSPVLSSDIIQFEGELDPLRAVLSNQHLIIFRRVWRGGQRYLQGAVIEKDKFFDELVVKRFVNSSLSAVGRLTIGDAETAQPTTLSQTLAPPLGAVRLSVELLPTRASRAVSYIWLLSGLSAGVLFFGAAALYRLGLAEILVSKAQRDFVSAVSHELKTPLTSIRMYGEMIRDGVAADPAKLRSYSDFICVESDRLARLISNVLRVAQLEQTDSALPLEPRNAQDLLHQVEAKIRPFLESKGFAYQAELSSDATVKVNDDAFTQVIMNLVENAVKFGSAGERRVVLSMHLTSVPRRELVIGVRDFGPGVPEGEMRKIFRLFYRSGDEMTRTTSGTGIGLSLVKELVTRMGGEVDVVNVQPGAKFEIRLPVEASTTLADAS